MEKKKKLKDRIQALTYMQTALFLFVLSLLLFVFCLWRSITTDGSAGALIAFTGILAFLVAVIGICVTLYGHFAVKLEGKINWIAGVVTNGMMAVIMLMLYISGIGG